MKSNKNEQKINLQFYLDNVMKKKLGNLKEIDYFLIHEYVML